MINGWKDPSWTNAKVMRSGLDADERDSREQIFGSNAIEIEQKTIPQLLVDEVSFLLVISSIYLTLYRPFILSISSKLPVSFCGPWMSITTTPSVSFLYHFSA